MKRKINLLSHDQNISRISEKLEQLYNYETIIQGPNQEPVFFHLFEKREKFSILDKYTGNETHLPHPRANKAVRVDDQIFATASFHSLKLWRFDNLSLIKEYPVFQGRIPQPYQSDGVARGLELLSGKFLIAFVSTGYWKYTPEKVFSRIFAVNIETGQTMTFDLSHLKEFMHYKIAAIPNKANQFVLYDHVLGNDYYVFELDETSFSLRCIAKHENLKDGGFYRLAISPDGQYWAMDMRYGSSKKPTFGLHVYTVDKDYKLSCIAKMFSADAPQWNGTTLLYSYDNRICEFNPKDLSHRVLTNKYSYSAHISPCLSDQYFQVARDDQLETYNRHQNPNNYATDWISQVSSHTPLPQALVSLIGDYAEIDTISKQAFSPSPLMEFGLYSLSKKPSKDGLVDIQNQNSP